MSNPFQSSIESWAKEREDLDAAESAAADGYTSNVSVPVLNGGVDEMRARTAYGDELKKRKEFAASFSSASDFDENTGSFSVDSTQMTPANRVKLSSLGGSYSGSANPFDPLERASGKQRVTFGEFSYEPDEETRRQTLQDFSTRTKWHRDFLSENIVPRLSSRIGADQFITWMDPEKSGQDGYHGDRIRLADVLPELNSTRYDNPGDDKSRARFDAILDGVYNQAGYLGLLPKSYDTGLKDNEAIAALDALGAPRWADGTGMWRNREQSNALRERRAEGGKLAKSSLDQVNYIFNTEAGWKLLGDSSWGRTGWSWGNALSTFGWDKENQESYQKELKKPRKDLDGYSIEELREYFEQAAEMDAADMTNPKARERLDYFTGLVQKRYNEMVEDRTWAGVLVDASARAATDEFVLNSWSTVRGIAGLFDSDYERDKGFWDRFAIHSEQNQTYSPEYKGDNWLLGGLQSAVELGVQQGKMAMVGLAGAGIGKGVAAARNIRQFGEAGRKIADMTDKLTGLQRLDRYADYGMRTGQWLSTAALNEADVAGQMAREYMARGLDPAEVGTGEKLALTAWYTGLDGMFNPFIKGMRTRVPGMRGMVGPDPTKILPPIWAGKGNMLKTVGNWIKAVGKDTAFEVGQEAAQQVGSNVWSAGRFGTFGMKSQKHSEVREDGTTDWGALWKNYKEQSIDIFWGTVFGAGGGAYGRARAEMQHDADIIKKLEAIPVREFARQGVELSDVKNLSVGDRLNLYEALRNHSAATAVKLKLGVAEAAGERGSELANSLQDQLRQLQANNAALYNRATAAGKSFLQRLNERTSGSAQVEFGGDNAQLRQGRENNRDSYQLDLGQLQASRDEQVEARKMLDKRGDKGPLVWGEPDGTDSPTQMRFVEEHDEDGNITEINIQNNKDVREPGGRPLTISRLEGETNDEVIARALDLAQDLANYHADLSLVDQDTAAFAQQFLKNLGVGNARVAFYSSTEDLTARIQEARKRQIEDGVPEDQLVTPSAVYNDLVDQDGKVRMDVGGAEFGNTVFIRRGANQTVGEMVATLAHEGAHVEIFNEAANLAQDGEAIQRLCEITGEDPNRVERFISDLENLGEQDRIFVLRGMLVGTDGAYEIAGMLARGREKMTDADKKKLDKFKTEAVSREETLAYTEQVEWNNPEANAHLPGTKWYQRAMTTIRHPMRAKQYYDFKSKYPTMDRVTQAVLSRFIGGGEVDADTAMNFIGALHQREGKDTDRAPQILMGAMGRPSRAYTATESLSMLVGSNLSRMTDFERGQLMSAMVRVNSLTKGEDGLDRAEALNRVIKELIAAGGHNAVVNEMLNQLQDESVLSPVALTQFVDASRAVEKYRNAGGDQLSKNQKIGNIDVGVIGNKEKIKPIETKKGETEATAPTAEPAPTATEEAPAPQESVPAPVITTNPSETPTGSTAPATPAAPATETPAPAEVTAPKGKRRMGKAKKPPETKATPVETESASAAQPVVAAASPEAAPQEAAAAPTPAEPEPTATPAVEIPAKVQTAIKGAASRATGSFKVETASEMLRSAQKKGPEALAATEDALRAFANDNKLTAKFSDVEVTDSKTKKKVSLRSVEFVPQVSSTTQDQIVASEQDEARAALEAGADARLSEAFNAGDDKLASEKDKIRSEAGALGLDVEFVDRRSPRNESIIISPVAKFSEKGANEVTQRKFEGDTSPVITDSRKDELRRVLKSGETRDGIELVATENGLFERQKRMGRQRLGKIGEGGVVQGPVDPNDKVELGSNATPRIVPEEERRAPKLVRGVARVLNLKDISSMEIKLIPADLQKKFAQAVKKTKRHKLRRTGDVNTAIDAMLMDAEDRGNIDALKDEIRALAMKNGAAVRFHQYTSDGKVYTESIFYPRKGITADQHKGGWLKRSEINGWLAEAYERGPEALLQAKEAIADIAAEEGWEVEFVGAGEDGSYEAREAIFHPQGTSGVPSKNLAKDEMPKRKLSESEVNHLRDYYKRDRKDAYLGESASIELIESVGDKESLAKAREGLEAPKKKSLAKKSQTAKKSEEAPAPAPMPEKPKGKRRMSPAKKKADETPVALATTPDPEPAAPVKAPEKKGKAKTEEKPAAPAPVKRGLLTDVEKNTLRAFAVKGLENLTDEEKGEYLRINAKNMKEADAVYKAAKGAAAKSGKESAAKPAESKAPSKETRAITQKRVDTAKALPQSVIEGAETARSNIEYNDEAVKGLNTHQKWDRFWRAGAKEPGAGAESTVAEDKAYDLVNSISGYNNAISVASDAAKPDDERSAARENIQKFRKAVERIVGKDVAADLFAGKDVKSSLDGMMKTWDETAEKQGVSGIRRTTEKGSRRAMIGGKTNARERQEAKMRRRMGKRFTSDEAKEFRVLAGKTFTRLSEKQAARLSNLEKKSPSDAEAIRNGGKSWIEARSDYLANKRAEQTEVAPEEAAEVTDVLDSIEDEDLRANLAAERAKLSPEDQESFNAMFAEDPKQAERYLAEAKGKLGIADEATEEEAKPKKRRIGKKITGAEELKGVEKYRMMFEELSNDANPDVRNSAAGVVAARIEDEINERERSRKSIPKGMRELLAEMQKAAVPQQNAAQGSVEARDAEFLADLKDPGDRSLAELLIQHRTRGETAQKNTSGTVIDDIKSPAALAALIPQLERAADRSPLAKNTKRAQDARKKLPKGAATYARLLDQAKRKWRTLTGESSWNEARAKELGYETDVGAVKSGSRSNGELWLIGAAANRQADANAGRHLLEDNAVGKSGARDIGAVGDDARDADDYEVRQGFQQSAWSEELYRRYGGVNQRRAIALNPNTPPATLNKLTHDTDAQVLRAVAKNPNTSDYALSYLAGFRGDGAWVAREVARRPNLSDKLMDKLAHHNYKDVRVTFAKAHPEYGMTPTEARDWRNPAWGNGQLTEEEKDVGTSIENDADVIPNIGQDEYPLMAVCGMSLSSLSKAINAGSFVIPSIALVPKEYGHIHSGVIDGIHDNLQKVVYAVFNKRSIGEDRTDIYVGDGNTGSVKMLKGDYSQENIDRFRRHVNSRGFNPLLRSEKSTLEKERGRLYNINGVDREYENLISATSSLPSDVMEAARKFGLGIIENPLAKEDDAVGYRNEIQTILRAVKSQKDRENISRVISKLEDAVASRRKAGDLDDEFSEEYSEAKMWRKVPISEAEAVIVDNTAPNDIERKLESLGVKNVIRVNMLDEDELLAAQQSVGAFMQSAESEQAAKRTRADDRADAKAASFRERFPLMAVHGLSISSLKSALDAGAFVMPSTAVALKEEGWTQAGFVNKTAPGTDSEVEDFYADPSEEEYKRYLEGSAFVLMPKAALQNRGELYTGDAFTPTINALLSRAAELGLADEEALSDESIERVRRRFDRGDIEPVNEADIESTRQRLIERKKQDDEMAAFEEAYGAAYDELYPDEEPEDDNRFTHDSELDHFDEGKIWRRMPIGEATAVIIDKAAADYDRSLQDGVIAQLEKAGVKVVEVDTNDDAAVVRAEQENAEFFQSAASEAESKRKPGRTLADDGRRIFGMRKKDINERIKERGDEHFVIGTRDGHRKMSMDEAFALAEMKTPEERKEIVKRAVDAANHGRDCFLTAEETPVLMAAVVAAEINHSRAFDEWQKAIASGDEDVARSAEGAALVAHAEMNELISALSNVKGSAGRALNIHKAALFDDLSFAGIAGDLLDAKREAEKDEEKRKSVTLTPEELKRCKERADEFAKYYDILRELEKAYGEEQAEKALLSLLREPRKRRLGKTYPTVDKAVQDAKDRVAVLEKRAPIDLADWEGTYGAIQELVRDIGDSILNEFKKDNPLKHMEVGAFLDRLKTECDKAFGHLTASDGSRGPLTAEEYRDLFTDADQFGKHPPAPENPVKAEIKRMLNATHMIYELEAVKKDPKQFPIDRYNKDHGTSLTEDDVDTEIERLKREHDDALRASGLSNGGPDAKTMPLDFEKMRTQNRIDELRRAIQNNKRIVRETRQPLLGDDELAAMKRELAELQNDYAVMVSDSMTDAEKIARLESMYEKRLESSTRELERLEGGGSFNTTRMSADGKHYLADTPKMAELKKQIAANQKKIRELQMAKRPEYEMDRYAAMRILETERRIKYAEEKAENYRNGVNPAERTRRIDQSWRMRPEAQKVLKDLRDAQKQLAKDRDEFFWKASKGPVKAYNGAMALIDMHRTIRASGDISGLGIQLAPYLLMHPEFLFKGGREAIKSMFKPEHYEKIRTAIESDPRLYMVMDVMGVKLTDIGASTRGGEREDVFRRRAAAGVFGDWSEKNLGLLHKAGKAYLEGSERGFNAPIVMARWEMATTLLDVLSEKFGGQDKIPQSDIKTAGRFINALTGKGDLFNNAGWFKGLLWAPGRLAGQIQAFTLPLSIAMGTTPASKELKRYIAREYYGKPLANAAKIAAALWLASMLLKGDDDDDDWFIEPDPRKPQFGKMKIGSRYFSLFGGEEAVIRLAAKAGSPLWGKRNFYGNEPKENRGNKNDDFLDTLTQFARGRVNPAVSALLTAQRGSTYTGEKIDFNRRGHLLDDNGWMHWLVFDNLLPLSWTDVGEVIWDGLGMGDTPADAKSYAGVIPLTALALAGFQGQDYGDTAYRRYEAKFDEFADKVKDGSWMTIDEKRELARQPSNTPFVSYPGKFERLKKLRSIIKDGTTILRSGKETAPKGKESKRVPLTTEEHDYARKQLEKFQEEFVGLIESDRRR